MLQSTSSPLFWMTLSNIYLQFGFDIGTLTHFHTLRYQYAFYSAYSLSSRCERFHARFKICVDFVLECGQLDIIFGQVYGLIEWCWGIM